MNTLPEDCLHRFDNMVDYRCIDCGAPSCGHTKPTDNCKRCGPDTVARVKRPIDLRCAMPTPHMCAREWAAQHELRILRAHGLEEFYGGCDTVDDLCEEILRLRRKLKGHD